jgi:hypothetical protein
MSPIKSCAATFYGTAILDSVLRDMAAPWPSPGAFALYHLPFIFGELYPLPPSLKKEFDQLLELYDRENRIIVTKLLS